MSQRSKTLSGAHRKRRLGTGELYHTVLFPRHFELHIPLHIIRHASSTTAGTIPRLDEGCDFGKWADPTLKTH